MALKGEYFVTELNLQSKIEHAVIAVITQAYKSTLLKKKVEEEVDEVDYNTTLSLFYE